MSFDLHKLVYVSVLSGAFAGIAGSIVYFPALIKKIKIVLSVVAPGYKFFFNFINCLFMLLVCFCDLILMRYRQWKYNIKWVVLCPLVINLGEDKSRKDQYREDQSWKDQSRKENHINSFESIACLSTLCSTGKPWVWRDNQGRLIACGICEDGQCFGFLSGSLALHKNKFWSCLLAGFKSFSLLFVYDLSIIFKHVTANEIKSVTNTKELFQQNYVIPPCLMSLSRFSPSIKVKFYYWLCGTESHVERLLGASLKVVDGSSSSMINKTNKLFVLWQISLLNISGCYNLSSNEIEWRESDWCLLFNKMLCFFVPLSNVSEKEKQIQTWLTSWYYILLFHKLSLFCLHQHAHYFKCHYLKSSTPVALQWSVSMASPNLQPYFEGNSVRYNASNASYTSISARHSCLSSNNNFYYRITLFVKAKAKFLHGFFWNNKRYLAKLLLFVFIFIFCVLALKVFIYNYLSLREQYLVVSKYISFPHQNSSTIVKLNYISSLEFKYSNQKLELWYRQQVHRLFGRWLQQILIPRLKHNLLTYERCRNNQPCWKVAGTAQYGAYFDLCLWLLADVNSRNYKLYQPFFRKYNLSRNFVSKFLTTESSFIHQQLRDNLPLSMWWQWQSQLTQVGEYKMLSKSLSVVIIKLFNHENMWFSSQEVKFLSFVAGSSGLPVSFGISSPQALLLWSDYWSGKNGHILKIWRSAWKTKVNSRIKSLNHLTMQQLKLLLQKALSKESLWQRSVIKWNHLYNPTYTASNLITPQKPIHSALSYINAAYYTYYPDQTNKLFVPHPVRSLDIKKINQITTMKFLKSYIQALSTSLAHWHKLKGLQKMLWEKSMLLDEDFPKKLQATGDDFELNLSESHPVSLFDTQNTSALKIIKKIIIWPMLIYKHILLLDYMRELNLLWREQIAEKFQTSLLSRYPFNVSSTINADDKDLSALFSDHGAFVNWWKMLSSVCLKKSSDDLFLSNMNIINCNINKSTIDGLLKWHRFTQPMFDVSGFSISGKWYPLANTKVSSWKLKLNNNVISYNNGPARWHELQLHANNKNMLDLRWIDSYGKHYHYHLSGDRWMLMRWLRKSKWKVLSSDECLITLCPIHGWCWKVKIIHPGCGWFESFLQQGTRLPYNII